MIAILLALLAVVNVTNPSVSYACDGSTAVYTVSFPYQTTGDLVTTSTTASGTVTTLAYTTDYSVNLASTSSTATLTLNSPASKCPIGNVLKIARNVALTQPTSFKAQTTYNPSLHETAYDRGVMQAQQINATLLGVTDSSSWVDSGVAAGTYGNGSNVPVITVDRKGRTINASMTPVVATGVGTTYTAPYPGAVAQTSAAKLAEIGVSPEDFGAKGDFVRTSLTFTNASTTVTGGGNFTSTDVGKLLIGFGAGAGGKDLATTITAVAGLSSITVANAAGTSATRTSAYMTDDAPAWTAMLAAVRGANTGALPVRVICNRMYGVGSRIEIAGFNLRLVSSSPGNMGRDGTQTAQGCGLVYAGKRGAHHISAASRASNVVTLTTADGIDLTGEYLVNDVVVVSGLVDGSYDGDCTLTAVTASTVSCTLIGANGSTTPIKRDPAQANIDVSGFGTDLVFMHGNIWSYFSGIAFYGNSGRPPLNLIHLEQAGGDPVNNQYNTFEHLTMGPKFLGDPQPGTPRTYFNGFYWSNPNANNDQMIFRNIYARGGIVLFNNFETQGTFHYAEKVQCQDNDICYIISSEWEVHSSFTALNKIIFVLGNGSISTSPTLRAWFAEDEGSLQYMNMTSEAGGSGATSADVKVVRGGVNTVPANTRVIDLTGSNVNFMNELELTDFGDGSGLGTATIAFKPANTCLTTGRYKFSTNIPNSRILIDGLTGGCGDSRSQATIWNSSRMPGSSQPVSESHQVLFGGGPLPGLISQQWDWPGNLTANYSTVNKLAQPVNTHCLLVGAAGGTTFFYKVAALVNGLSSALSAETSCVGASVPGAANYVWVDFKPVIGAQKMRLWRGTVAATENQFCDFDITSLFGDGNNGQPNVRDNCTFTGGTPPTADQGTGSVTMGGSLNMTTGTTFANIGLGSVANGTVQYCSDCTIANPCAGGGTGAIAKRLNGVWVCN